MFLFFWREVITLNKNTQAVSLLKTQNEILKMVAAGKSLPSILKKICHAIEDVIPGALSSILIFDEESNTLGDCVGPSLEADYIKAIDGIKVGPIAGSCGTAAYRKEMVIVKNIESDLLWEDARSLILPYGLRACWSKPILSSDEKLLGTFALYYREPRNPESSEINLLEAFAHLASVPIERKKVDEKLYLSQLQYRLMTENVSDFVGILDSNGMYEYASPSHEKYLGYSAVQLIGNVAFNYVHPDDLSEVKHAFGKLVQNNEKEQVSFRLKLQHGGWLFLEGIGTPIIENNGEIHRYVYVARDMTVQKKAEQNLRETNEFLNTLIQFSPVAIVALDKESNVKLWNDKAEEIFGWEKSEVLGRPYPLLYGEMSEQQEWYREILQGGKVVINKEVKRRKKDGSLIDVRLTIGPTYNKKGEFDGAIAMLQDISQQRKAEMKVYQLAYYDTLTNLPNQTAFKEDFIEVLEKAKKKDLFTALLYIDVNRFKYINDTLGIEFGDDLLKMIANRLTSSHQKVYRISGDEFAMIITDTTQKEVMDTVHQLIQIFEKPFSLGHHHLHIGISIGISFYPEHGPSFEALYKYANVALRYCKKNETSHYQVYSDSMSNAINKQMQLEEKLHMAVKNEEFVLYYQPQIDLKTGDLIGSEALIRWNSSDLGLVSPTDFIPIAEDTGLIIPIGKWVLREACKQQVRWMRDGISLHSISVNVSPQQFYEDDFVKSVTDVLTETGIDPRSLILEITETVVLQKANEAIRKIVQLRNMGLKVALDDFGTGFSSLNYLKDLPIDIVKIDKSFLQDMDTDSKAKEILKTIIHLSQKLGLKVLAEGIENKEHYQFLKEHECEEGQGFLFSAPIPNQKFLTYIQERQMT